MNSCPIPQGTHRAIRLPAKADLACLGFLHRSAFDAIKSGLGMLEAGLCKASEAAGRALSVRGRCEVTTALSPLLGAIDRPTPPQWPACSATVDPAPGHRP